MSFTVIAIIKAVLRARRLYPSDLYVSRETLIKVHMKQDKKRGIKNEIGGYGEKIAAKYLEKLGFVIVETNYLKKWGEIDIVARGTGKIRFIEVKTVSYETKQDMQTAISRGTWRPEENVHKAKMQRLNRAIESWILENKCDEEWEIDIIAVRLVLREKYATVKYLPNAVLD
jgi:putative endonuclease